MCRGNKGSLGVDYRQLTSDHAEENLNIAFDAAEVTQRFFETKTLKIENSLSVRSCAEFQDY